MIVVAELTSEELLLQICTRLNNLNKLVSSMREDEDTLNLMDEKVQRELANLYSREAQELETKVSKIIWQKLMMIYIVNLYAENLPKVIGLKNNFSGFKQEIGVLLKELATILDNRSYNNVCRQLFGPTLDSRVY